MKAFIIEETAIWAFFNAISLAAARRTFEDIACGDEIVLRVLLKEKRLLSVIISLFSPSPLTRLRLLREEPLAESTLSEE